MLLGRSSWLNFQQIIQWVVTPDFCHIVASEHVQFIPTWCCPGPCGGESLYNYTWLSERCLYHWTIWWEVSQVETFRKYTKTPSGWWFQPPWKIWKSDWIIIPTIGENNSHVPVTTNQTKTSLGWSQPAGEVCFRKHLEKLRISWIQNKLIQQSELLKDDQNSTEKRWNQKEYICIICISSIYRWDFPWNKPSSELGVPP